MTQTVTIKEPQAPASDKQISFLTTLLKERECPSVEEKVRFAKSIGLTKGVASKLIDEALKAPKKTGQTNTVQDWGKAKAVQADAEQPEAPKLTELPAEGYYDLDGKLYFWAKTKKDYKPRLRIWSAPNWGGVKWTWKTVYTPYAQITKIDGTWVPNLLLEAVANGAKPMTVEEIGAKGKQLNFCLKCGAQLTDPISVAQGIGPVCIKTIGKW
jgi:hypothetical protein